MDSFFRSGILVICWLGCFFTFQTEYWFATGCLVLGIIMILCHAAKTFGWFEPLNDGMSEAEMREIEEKLDAQPPRPCLAHGDHTAGTWFPDPNCWDPSCVHKCWQRRGV